MLYFYKLCSTVEQERKNEEQEEGKVKRATKLKILQSENFLTGERERGERENTLFIS